MKKPQSPEPPKWPYSSAEYCTFLKEMDEYYGTTKDSPLHHDNRCVLRAREDN